MNVVAGLHYGFRMVVFKEILVRFLFHDQSWMTANCVMYFALVGC